MTHFSDLSSSDSDGLIIPNRNHKKSLPSNRYKRQIRDESSDDDESQNVDPNISSFKSSSKHNEEYILFNQQSPKQSAVKQRHEIHKYHKKRYKSNHNQYSPDSPPTNNRYNSTISNNHNRKLSQTISQPNNRTQTKLTQFFTPASQRQCRQKMSPKTALKGTPYQGLNVSVRNKYDDMSLSEITTKIANYQKMLNDEQIRNRLPDNGKKIKLKIQLLDEALIRNQARKLIHDKNMKDKQFKPIRQRLDFDASNHGKTKILSLGSRMRTHSDHQFRGLAKNLDQSNLKDLINSIQSMSINPLDSVSTNNHEQRQKIKISEYLKAKLYPHQIDGYEWMVNREIHNDDNQPFGGIIADEMGLGKTMQMIALMLDDHDIPIEENNKYLKSLSHSQCTLIICPVSVMDHWETEIKRWTQTGKLIVYKYHGNNRLKDKQRLSRNYKVIITTYGCVQSEYNEWRKLEDVRLCEMKDTRKQLMVLQRYQERYGDLNDDRMDLDKLKKLKIKLQSLVNKKYERPILSEILWKRIVLDEAHQIKNHKSKTHKAICDLRGRAYWFMTATPIQNSLDDLYAAFHFLRYKYYQNYTNWKQGILNHGKGIQRIKTILAGIMLRRLKSDYIENGTADEQERKVNDDNNDDDGRKKRKKLINLPDKKMVTYLVEFSKYERFIYDQLSSLMNRIFSGYHKNNSIGKNFSQCLKMLLQLRQSCNHLLLIKNSVSQIHNILNGNRSTNNMDIKQLLSVIDNKNNNKNAEVNIDDIKDDIQNDNQFEMCSQEYLEEIKHALESRNDECPICLDIIDNVSITNCGHRFCTECLDEIMNERESIFKRKYKAMYNASKHFNIDCPVCRKKLKQNDVTRIVNKETEKKEDEDGLCDLNEYQSSKLKKLMELLDDLHFNGEPDAKCVIFSQWTSMLDIIEIALKNKDYGFCRLDGKMSALNRSKSINKLNTDSDCWIMLISLKAGGVGLNLVSANHVFMMDQWWNPAVEDQAFDRVHRIGQTKNVIIHRIIIQNSVEQKVLKLQEKKRKIAKDALTLNGNNRNNNKKRSSVNLSARDLIDLFYDE